MFSISSFRSFFTGVILKTKEDGKGNNMNNIINTDIVHLNAEVIWRQVRSYLKAR